jgi:hypothetical protein
MKHRLRYTIWLVVLTAAVAVAQEPALPEGLGGSSKENADEPSLPAGLGASTDEPELPDGLGGGESSVRVEEDAAREGLSLPFELTGFAEVRTGWRTQTDPVEDEESITEARLQLEADKRWAGGGLKVAADFLYDAVADDEDIDLHRGQGWIDLRQANIYFTPLSFMDVKVGRQILTWGTGDLLFINDNFPKDWVSFFSGRDVEYLKAPSDAAKVSLFGDWVNVDVIYTPQFDPDRYISGERISYYNAGLGRLAGEDAVVEADRPDDWFSDDEWAVRAYRNLGGTELALYGYDGFWKSPAGQNMEGEATFPRLSVYGASVRGNFAAGIGNLEVGLQDSRDDGEGDDPMVRNSEFRVLAGYEQDLSFIAPDFTIGLQYYLEQMLDYEEYEQTLPEGMPAADEHRHVLTLRLTKQLLQQNLELSVFTYYSPSDEDGYLRPAASYKVTDDWLVAVGGNVFFGDEIHTFFGQFENNNNVYASARYSF